MVKKSKTTKDELTRIAIINPDKCKPKDCGLACKKTCPVVRTGGQCIDVTKKSKVAIISEVLCIGCNLCVQKCPQDAIRIIRLPSNLESNTVHRFGPNTFKLHRLPRPRPGNVLGLVGTNGIGKSTALQILSGRLTPNLGQFDDPPDWDEIRQHFRGNELQTYFTLLLEDNIRCVTKPQYVDNIPKVVKGVVETLLLKRCGSEEVMESLLDKLDLDDVRTQQINTLSGGQLQRFAIAVAAATNANVLMFDEPSSYLDVQQRLIASRLIRELQQVDNYIIVVEHDLAVLDYLSDYVQILYGTPAAYGVVTMPASVREGINHFLAGFLPAENLRFRPEPLKFRIAQVALETNEDETDDVVTYKYPSMEKSLGSFMLHVESGTFNESEITVLLGRNGTGKTTFIRMLAGQLSPDEDENGIVPTIHRLEVSYKPQKLSSKKEITVRQYLTQNCKLMNDPIFQRIVLKGLNIEPLYNNVLKFLSGGELQRVAIAWALGRKNANIFLIDEPSAYLDAEQRVECAKCIRQYIYQKKKTAFIVEHDFIMATYLADKVIVYDGRPAFDCTARTPQSLLTGMNAFLEDLEVTFRRDPSNYRPRINKPNSQKDQEQKRLGQYFFMNQ
eukprot:TRINITY_DN2964_c0_g1_i2.p1 TRINITY_DN2964_c0_g1~~TRINITY_DN2964_c0_g1_i2.p1  ORF type:complete len:616 (+),score=181.83 TRINITY_DN2964_c0_g1_i2:33-1880(+)